jgi:aryl-alcohol dehydrogenase-like predicted oxidoreductase
MQYSRLGTSGLKVSELCLGAMTFGQRFHNIGVVDQQQADEMVRAALEAGVDFFDTADGYSQGQSEEILGRALKTARVPRASVVVATKVYTPMSDQASAGIGDVNNAGLSRKHVVEGCHASLRRLGVDYIDLYQIHRFDAGTPLAETLEALNDLVRQGKVLYIGCSNIAARSLAKALGISMSRKWASFASLQAYYSLVARDLEHELLPLCREEGLGLLAWSPLSGGYLSGKYRQGSPEVGRRNEFDFPPVAANAAGALGILEEIASERGASMARVALAWVRQQPGVTSVIVGARNTDQLRDNLAAADLELAPEELRRLSETTQPSKLYPEWMLERRAGSPARASR